MRYWTYCEPHYLSTSSEAYENLYYTYSDGDILEEYWEFWAGEMVRLNRYFNEQREPLITSENCINDWVVTHWACRTTVDGVSIWGSHCKS
tara:strand:+ start:2306 stop:2578 length:273 start_codon:yes stop_codon:yes gene_type:complete